MPEESTEAVEQDAAEEVEQETPDVETDPAPEADADDVEDWRKDFDPDKASERIRKYQSENKNLRNRAKEAEEKAKGVGEKDEQITSLTRTTTQLEVGYDLGLPKALALRLAGGTRDEMLEDAKSLLELVKPRSAPIKRRPLEDLRGGSEPEQEPEETDLDKLGSRMFRR